MRAFRQLLAAMIFISATGLAFIAGLNVAVWIGRLTHSGLLGICGPYGKHAGLVAATFLGTFLLAPFAGMVATKVFYQLSAGDAEIEPEQEMTMN